MFYGCVSLLSLDLIKFDMINPEVELYDMFFGVNTNLTYCINENVNPYFSSQLTNFKKDCLYICLTNSSKKYIIEENKCLDNCYDSNGHKFEYNSTCYEKCPNGTKQSLTNNFLCEIRNDVTGECNAIDAFNNKCKFDNNKENNVKKIKDGLKSGALDPLIANLMVGDKKDLLIERNDMVYQITTSDNQNNKEYYNISTIKLGECENILKVMNGINIDEPLLIFKIDYYSYGSLVPIINYEVYNPNTKEKLELDYFKDELIGVNLPVSINNNIDKDNLFKNDPKSDYYTDVCYKYTTEDGTDILLNDRYKEYNDNNLFLE